MAVAQGAMLIGKVKRDSQLVEATFREATSHLKAYAAKEDTVSRTLRLPASA
jgi:hypothetical protein